MQKREIEQVFQVVCGAFPRSNVKILSCTGETELLQERLDGVRTQEQCTMQKEATVCGTGKHALYRITLPLWPAHQLFLYLQAKDYPDVFAPVRMVEALLKQVERGQAEERAHPAPAGENPLLNSLLYADTMEMKIYTSLLAEEEGKSLELPRVVCILDGGKPREVAQAVYSFRETGEQDICGLMGENRFILCRHLKERAKSIRYQCDGYLNSLCHMLRERYGYGVRIWVGTAARRMEDYRRSMEVASFAGKCAGQRTNAGSVVYATDYILEYTFQNTDQMLQQHFLERYAERLRQEPQLVDTAEALLENNMNLSLAAAQQFMHRNTMTLYAGRLRRLLSIDPLHSDSDRFLLMLICAYYRRYY